MIETATEFQLKLIRWQFFATFTWKCSTLGSVASRDSDLWGFLRAECQRRGMKLIQLQAAVRWERGEVGDRPHCHALLSGMPSETCKIRNAEIIAGAWLRQFGHAKVKVVSHNLEQNPFAYLLLKGRDEGNGHR